METEKPTDTDTVHSFMLAERRVSIMDGNDLPIGFAMGMAMRENAMNAYSKLTEAEKERLLNECRDAKSKTEMERIIDRLSGDWF